MKFVYDKTMNLTFGHNMAVIDDSLEIQRFFWKVGHSSFDSVIVFQNWREI
jgi:hypothetical protein